MRDPPEPRSTATFPELAWEPGARTKSLDALFRYAAGEAGRAIDWYERKRRRAQRAGRLLRLGAVLATSAAGVLPLLGALLERHGRPAIDPLASAFALALAGSLVLLDRFWGCTSAWVRYVRATQELTAALDAFRIDWEHHHGDRCLGGGVPPRVRADRRHRATARPRRVAPRRTPALGRRRPTSTRSSPR